MPEQTKFPVGTRVRTSSGPGYVISRQMYRGAWSITPMIPKPRNIVAYIIHDNGQVDCTDKTDFETWEKGPTKEETPPTETETRIRQLVKDEPNAAVNAILEMVVELFAVQARLTELLYPLAKNHAHVIDQTEQTRIERQRHLNELAVYAALLAEMSKEMT